MAVDDIAISQRVLPLIDLTSLGSNDTPAMIEALCDAATTPHGNVAAVCVWPKFVELAVERLTGTGVPVAAVANFPEGETDIERAVADSCQIVEAGGAEVDVVFPWRALVDGSTGVGTLLVSATRAVLNDSIVLKVILETGELKDPDLIRTAANEAILGGSNMLKTSTGKTDHGASTAAARVLFELVAGMDSSQGVKISGGVRTVAQAGDYLDLADEILGANWVTPQTLRFGASSLLTAVLESLDRS